MKNLALRLKTVSPLAIRADHSADTAKSASYIPATTLMGGLAAVHRRLYPEKKEEFAQFFLRDQILYPDLHPASFKKIDEAIQASNHLAIYPLPKTAQSCKRYQGFLFPESDENDAHGVRDSLIDWALFKIGDSPAYKDGSIDPLAALREHKRCTCGEAMDHFIGYYRRANTRHTHPDNGTKFYPMFQAEAHTRLQTHTGIDRESGIVQDGILYNREVFAEETRFWGMVKILNDDEELFSRFKQFLEDVGYKKEYKDSGKIDHGGLVRIGTGRTRGMGQVEFQVEEQQESTDRFQHFIQRLEAFNTLLHDQARAFFKRGDLDQLFFFALTLHSPLILCDDLLRYRSSIDEQALVEILKQYSENLTPVVEIPDLQLHYQAASVLRLSGWLELWGLPRMNEYAIDTGSVFLFSCPNPSAERQEALFEKLFALEEYGAGKRRAEGFGHVCVSDQFHQEITLR